MKLEEAFNYPEFLEAGEALVIETLVSFAVYCAESHMHTWRISVTIAKSFCSQFLQNSHEAASRVFPVFLDIFLRLIFVSCVWAFCLHVACVLKCWAISPATSEQFSIGSAIFKSSCPPPPSPLNIYFPFGANVSWGEHWGGSAEVREMQFPGKVPTVRVQ